MPRTARARQGGYCYHVLNRSNGRRTVIPKDGDCAAFLKLLRPAAEWTPMRFLASCLMPNHFPLALWPQEDGQLSEYMRWLLTAHVRRYHPHYHSSGHDGLEHVNEPQTEAEVERWRESLRCGRPYGASAWREQTARCLGREASLRLRGRPRKQSPEQASLFEQTAEGN